jgi:hypothetical protein
LMLQTKPMRRRAKELLEEPLGKQGRPKANGEPVTPALSATSATVAEV